MKILLAHNYYSVRGGAEVFVQEIARILRSNGHEVAHFTCAEEGIDAPLANHFPTVRHYADGGLAAKIVRIPSIIYNREASQRMTDALEAFRPDIVHAFAIYGRLTPSILDAIKVWGIPVVLSCNDYKHICPNYKLYHHGKLCEDCKGGRFYSAIRNRCCHDSLAISAVSALEAYTHERLDLWRRNVDRFLFASRFMADKTIEFWGEGQVEMSILRNPFDSKAHHIEPNVGNSILYFGRLIEEKGLDILLDAARHCPNVSVVIAGDGPGRQKVEEAADRLDNVRFVGPAWGDDLKQLMWDARAVVVPSLWHENFPYVILQAFAASKPVIGARRGGIPELVEAGPHGWLFEPTNLSELISILQRVSQLEKEEIKTMGARAQSFVSSTFHDDAIYTALKRIYEEVEK